MLKLRQAQSAGAHDLLVNSTNLIGSIRKGVLNSENCCHVMKDEMKPGDVLVDDWDSGIGMTIRYQLPRSQNEAAPTAA